MLQLRFPTTTLYAPDVAAITNLFDGMDELRALYLSAPSIDYTVVNAILSACPKLQHLQCETVFRGQIRYTISNIPSQWLVFDGVAGSFIEAHAAVRKIGMLVDNASMVAAVAKAIATYPQHKDFGVEHISIRVQPGHSLVDIHGILSAFLVDCMPKWSKLQTLQSMSLTADGFSAEIPRPVDSQAKNDIFVTLHDSSYIAGKLTPLQDFDFVVIVSDTFPYYEGNAFVPAEGVPEHVRQLYAGGVSEFGGLASIESMRELHFLGGHLKKFLQALPALTTEPHSFAGLVTVTAAADVVVDKRSIPFDDLADLESFQHLHLYAASQAFTEANVAKCHGVLGTDEPRDADGVCFYRSDA